MMPLRNRTSLEEAAWAEALTMAEFGYADIATRLKMGIKMATAFLRGWASQGRLTEAAPGHGGRKLWRVAEGAAAQTRRALVRTPELNMWTAMRPLKSFTPSALAAHATVDEVRVCGVPGGGKLPAGPQPAHHHRGHELCLHPDAAGAGMKTFSPAVLAYLGRRDGMVAKSLM